MGKLIVLLVVVMLIVWLVRGNRPARPGAGVPPAPPGSGSNSAPQAMLACALCGVHLPESDALPGRGGVFCGEAHRAEFERKQAPR